MSRDELHDSFADDAAAYVLGALTEPEHEAFVAHLADCPACREDVTSLRAVVSALPAAVPQHSVPGELKGRVMATVQRESGLRAARPAPAGQRRARRPWPRRGDWSLLGAAGAAAAVIAVLAVVIAGSGGSGSTRVVRAQVTGPQGKVLLRLSGGRAEIDATGLPQAPSERVYEVWVKRAGAAEPTNALFTVNRTGAATVTVPGTIKGVKQIMVTAEPRGGSRTPTGTPVMVASL